MTMTAFDFVSTIVMATLVATTMLSARIRLLDGMAALTVIVGLQTAVAYGTSRNSRLLRLLTASPRLLLWDSRFLHRNLLAERISPEQLAAEIRAAGYPTTDNVTAAVLESAGTVSVIGEARSEQPITHADLLEQVAGSPGTRSRDHHIKSESD
jgi:uncharacterized membrane protein YcaP (DUF421 family)